MKNLYKILFILSGLTIIGVSFVWAKEHVIPKSQKEAKSVLEGKKFEDWVVTCANDISQTKKCFLSQIVSNTKDGKTEVLASYNIGYFNNDNKLQMVQTFPLGTNLEAGTTIISDKKLLAAGKFKICTIEGCQAIADISHEDFNFILKNNSNIIGIINAEAKQINYPISNKGLKEGLEYLK